MSELDTVRITMDDVVLVDDHGEQLGTAPRSEVHTTQTPLHRAFSVYLFDPQGRTLITRRALTKVAWPGVWSNSCCGHPRPGESMDAAIERRVGEELGVGVRDLAVVLPDFRYRAVDASGIVEHEVCPVYVGRVDDDPSPDPDEVMDYAWVPWPDAVDALTHAPAVFSPWMGLQVPLLGRDLPPAVRPLDQDATNAHEATDPSSPSVEDTLGAVHRLLEGEAQWAQSFWATTGLEPQDDPILEQDLPTWLASLVDGRGKMIRPRMCHWGYVAAGGLRDDPAYGDLCQAAAALELLHVFALIHDDVMDESHWRRGRPAAHAQARDWHVHGEGHGDPARFGDNIAILLGDLAHMQADRMVSGLPRHFRDAWHELCTELIAGQGADLTGAAASSRSYAQADRVARLKSGSYTIERPLLLGALAAGAGREGHQALASYGRRLGQAFALRDDILGVWGDPEVTGKPGGDDLRSRKPTILWMLAQEGLQGDGRSALCRVGTAQEGAEDVSTVQRAMLDAGLRDRVESQVSQLVEEALADLGTGSLSAEGTHGLRRMAERVAWRES
ncbi:MAG: isopentenyl-diphosphate Delta-isomerase [Ornithinimicrobium sp.]